MGSISVADEINNANARAQRSPVSFLQRLPINPEAWDYFLEHAPETGNIEDRRDPLLVQRQEDKRNLDLILNLVKEKK